MFKIFIPDAGKMMNSALRQYRDATHKDEAAIINNEGLNTARETLRRIPKAASASVRAAVGTRNAPSKLAFWLAMRKLGKGAKRADIAREAQRIVSLRMRSIAYIKAGQVPIIKAFGGKGKDPSPKGHAARSTGRRASAAQISPTAWLTNRATGAGLVGAAAQEAALAYRATRLEASARRRLSATAQRFSAK